MSLSIVLLARETDVHWMKYSLYIYPWINYGTLTMVWSSMNTTNYFSDTSIMHYQNYL